MSEDRIAELEAEIAERGRRITAIDDERAKAVKERDALAGQLTAANKALDALAGQLTAANKALDAMKTDAAAAIASREEAIRKLQVDLAASKAETAAANAKVQRLFSLHQRAGQLLSSTAKAMQDEINHRNGIDLATGE